MESNFLAVFVQRSNTLIECKLILADKAITGVLKFIASCPPLLQCAKSSLEEYTYAQEFVRCRSVVTLPDKSAITRLKPPPTPARIFSFVLCLLTEFDTNKRSLTDFLNDFYPMENPNDSYSAFADQFLRPFKHAGESILSSADPESFNYKQEEIAEKYFNQEHIYISSAASQALLTLIDKLRVRLDYESFFSQQEKQDCFEILFALERALQLKNPKLIRLIWIGFKNTLTRQRIAEPYIKAIYALLVENNLI